MWGPVAMEVAKVWIWALKSSRNFHYLLCFLRTAHIILHPKLCKYNFKTLPWLRPSGFP